MIDLHTKYEVSSELSLQGFQTFNTSTDQKLPLTSMRSKVLHSLQVDMYTKYKIYPSFTFGVSMLTRFQTFNPC